MSNLATEYLGLKLKNPIVVGACSLTLDAAGVKKCADAGAGAVVLKSLFEEQIRLDTGDLDTSLQAAENWHAEVFAYMEANIGMRYGTREYLQVIKDSKATVDIPVIASINCVSTEWWQDFAGEVAAAGADALELNIALLPRDLTVKAEELSAQCRRIVATAAEAVDIPVAVKLSPYFTSLPQTVIELRRAGADGFVLFNRLYRPTIDIDNLSVVVSDPFSHPAELSVSLRWICLLAGRIDADFAISTGVHTGDDAIRALLGGADVVQVVSTLYHNGTDTIGTLIERIDQWMHAKNYTSVDDFRGLLSQARNPDNELFGRCQYIKGLVGLE